MTFALPHPLHPLSGSGRGLCRQRALPKAEGGDSGLPGVHRRAGQAPRAGSGRASRPAQDRLSGLAAILFFPLIVLPFFAQFLRPLLSSGVKTDCYDYNGATYHHDPGGRYVYSGGIWYPDNPDGFLTGNYEDYYDDDYSGGRFTGSDSYEEYNNRDDDWDDDDRNTDFDSRDSDW